MSVISRQKSKEVLMDERRAPHILDELVIVREGLKELTVLVEACRTMQ